MNEKFILGICLIMMGLLVLCFTLLLREQSLVLPAYNKAHDLMIQYAEEDALNHKPWRWRFDQFHSVSEDELTLIFWRSPESFFDTLACCRPTP